MRNQNEELKYQIHLIKEKLLEFKAKINNNIPKKKSLLNPKYTEKYNHHSIKNCIKENRENKLKELQKQIEYYEEEIAIKKYQLDNLYPITRYLNMKDEILQEKKKMEKLKLENDTLLYIYDSGVKNNEQKEIEVNLKNIEEKNKEKLLNIRNEIRFKEISFKELNNKLKEKRNNYSKLINNINIFKSKIKEAKYLKFACNYKYYKKLNFDEEIEKEQKRINDEEKKFFEEEKDYKKKIKQNEKEINRLNSLILEKKNFLKKKKDNIRNQEIYTKNKKSVVKNKNNFDDKNKINSLKEENIKNEEIISQEEEKEVEIKRNNIFFVTEQTNKDMDNKDILGEISIILKGGEISIHKKIENTIENEDRLDNNNNLGYIDERIKENGKKELNIKDEDKAFNIDNKSNLESNLENYENDNNNFENDLENLSCLILSEKSEIQEKKNSDEKNNNMVKSNNFI